MVVSVKLGKWCHYLPHLSILRQGKEPKFLEYFLLFISLEITDGTGLGLTDQLYSSLENYCETDFNMHYLLDTYMLINHMIIYHLPDYIEVICRKH